MKPTSPILSVLVPRPVPPRLSSTLKAFAQTHSTHPTCTASTQPQIHTSSRQRSNLVHVRRALSSTTHRAQQDQALTEELRKLTQSSQARDGTTSGPMLGPFMMPRGRVGERPLNAQERQGWKQASWSERTRRIVRNGRNVLVVSVGGCIGLLVVYSITSELFAPSSPTNLMLATIDTLECSQSLKTILRTPYIFHTPQHLTSKPGHNTTPTAYANSHHTVQLRFIIEGSPVCLSEEGDWREMEWWKGVVKKWISPLITLDVGQPARPITSSSDADSIQSSDYRQGTWLTEFFGSLLPKSFSDSKNRQARSRNERPGWLERRSPTLGTYEQGEVTAEISKEPGGGWKYKSLYVEFPDAQRSYYRLDVLTELRKSQAYTQTEERPSTRYRFWSRKISVA